MTVKPLMLDRRQDCPFSDSSTCGGCSVDQSPCSVVGRPDHKWLCFSKRSRWLIDVAVYAVNVDYSQMANDFTRLRNMAKETDVIYYCCIRSPIAELSWDHENIVEVLLGQLLQLFGLNSESLYVGSSSRVNLLVSERGFREWELDLLARQHTCFNLRSCATTLGSFSRLVQLLPRMIIKDEAGKQSFSVV